MLIQKQMILMVKKKIKQIKFKDLDKNNNIYKIYKKLNL